MNNFTFDFDDTWSRFDFGDLSGWDQVDQKANVSESIPIGYSLGKEVLGRALLSGKQNGMALIRRLKDTRPLLEDEIWFWGGLLYEMMPQSVDFLTCAPSSRKVPHDEHLAHILARSTAARATIPFSEFFVNQEPRGHRATTQEKLREIKDYKYLGPKTEKKVVVIDDVVQTRQTAKACQLAAYPDFCFFVVLYA